MIHTPPIHTTEARAGQYVIPGLRQVHSTVGIRYKLVLVLWSVA